MTKICIAAAILATLLATPARAGEDPHKLYCAAGKIQVDQRRFEVMKQAYGKDVCSFGDFTSRTAADNRAMMFGGAGAKCSCH